MNPLLEPGNLLEIAIWYFSSKNRLKRYSPEKMEKYRDRAFRNILKYAYTVPLYREKFREAGINIRNIRGITDIEKLPFVSKEEIRKNYPDGVLPSNADRKKFYPVSTGGTTGRPVSIFVDFVTMAQTCINFARDLSNYGFNWKNTRFAHIGNLSPNRIDMVMEEHFWPYIKRFFSADNVLNIDVNNTIEEIMKTLNIFKPDVILTYPAIHQHLAILKRKGKGKNVKPKLLLTGGAMLDDYTREYVEDAFKCKLLNVYSSVESQSDIAIECYHRTWHINYDLFHLEAIDEDGNVVAPGERGHLVITRMWGKGTPIIRYTGMDDWVRISYDEEKCPCGLKTPVLVNGVEGRQRATIVLPNGKVFPPGAFCFISPVLHKLGTFKVKQYQIIQRRIDLIEILLVIDEDLRDVGPSVEMICEEIKKVYRERVGPDVEIVVREVKEIKNEENPNKPPPIVVSHVGNKIEDV